MPLVKTPKPTFAQKLKRFFMVDLLKGLGLTLKYNLGAITDKDAVAGKEFIPNSIRRCGPTWRRDFTARHV